MGPQECGYTGCSGYQKPAAPKAPGFRKGPSYYTNMPVGSYNDVDVRKRETDIRKRTETNTTTETISLDGWLMAVTTAGGASFEYALDGAKDLPSRLRKLAELKVSMLVGCPA